MSKAVEKDTDTLKDISVEETFEQIEAVIKNLESGEVSLDDSFLLYQQGIEKLKQCHTKLDEVEKKMQILNNNGELADF